MFFVLGWVPPINKRSRAINDLLIRGYHPLGAFRLQLTVDG